MGAYGRQVVVIQHTHYDEEQPVRGLAPETQVDLSRCSVTIELCDSYCLGIGDYRVVQWRSLYMGFG